MEALPQTLQCLTIQHSINDPNVIEYFLRENPVSAEKCIPIAFREVFVIPTIQFGAPAWVDSRTLLDHLIFLWSILNKSDEKLSAAVENGVYYFIPALIGSAAVNVTRLVRLASYRGDPNTLALLMNMFPEYVDRPDELLWNAASLGRKKTVAWLLSPHTLSNPLRKVTRELPAANPNYAYGGILTTQFSIERGEQDIAKLLFDAGAKYHPMYRNIAKSRRNIKMLHYMDELAREQTHGIDGGSDKSGKPHGIDVVSDRSDTYWPVLKPVGQGSAPGMRVEKLAEESDGVTEYVLVFKTGDEVMSGLLRFAKEHNVPSASVTAIGALERAMFGWYNPEKKAYKINHADEQVELTSFDGNITVFEGKPALHAHVNLAKKDGSVVGGHALELFVLPTVEMFVSVKPTLLTKKVVKAGIPEIILTHTC